MIITTLKTESELKGLTLDKISKLKGSDHVTLARLKMNNELDFIPFGNIPKGLELSYEFQVGCEMFFREIDQSYYVILKSDLEKIDKIIKNVKFEIAEMWSKLKHHEEFIEKINEEDD